MAMRLARAAIVAVVLYAMVATPAPAQASSGWNAAFLSQDPWPTVAPGAAVSYTIRFRNAGTQTWQRGVAARQVNLAVSRDSEFFPQQGYPVGWYAPPRPAPPAEATVAPGATAPFTSRAPGPAFGSYTPLSLHT
mgnify:CR=1 FL=1